MSENLNLEMRRFQSKKTPKTAFKYTDVLQAIEPKARIGFIGLTQVGKTTYLSVLQFAMQLNGWDIYWFDDETRKLLTDNFFQRMILKGTYPLGTEREQENRYIFHAQQSPSKDWISNLIKGKKPAINVEIQDIAGARFGVDEPDRELFSEYIPKCDGIIFLIDPTEDASTEQKRSYFKFVLMNAFTELTRYRSRQKTFVAFCVTKMDLYPRAWGQPEKFVKEGVFNNDSLVSTQLKSFCNPAKGVFCKWFSSTNIGRIDGSNGDSRHYKDENGATRINDSDNLKPEGVAEPLIWLLSQIEKKSNN